MIDQKTTNQEYPLPNPDNKLSVDVLRIQDTFEKIDVDVGILHTASTNASAEIDNIRNGRDWYAASTGFGSAYQIVLSPSPSALTVGQVIHMTAHVQNTGSATLDVNGLGVKTIKKTDGSDLRAGDILTNAACFLFYDGTNFQLINPKVDQEQLEVVTSNLMMAFEEIQDSHGGSLNMETGWSDSFANANEQGADEANSLGYHHDPTNKLYKGTEPGIGLNSDKDYDAEANFLQQEWNATIIGGNATFTNGTATVTLNVGTWPTNCRYGRITADGVNFYEIDTRDNDTQITLRVNFAQSTSSDNNIYKLYLSKFSNNTVELSTYNEAHDTGEHLAISIYKKDGFRPVGDATGGQAKCGQSFTTTASGTLDSIKFNCRKNGSPSDNYFCEIYETTGGVGGVPTGSTLATSNNIPASGLATTFEVITFNFSGANRITLNANTQYAAVLARSGSLNSSNYLIIDGGIEPTYPDGSDIFYRNGAWNSNAGYKHQLVLTYATGNVSSEYVSVCDKEAKKTDTSAWSNISTALISQKIDEVNLINQSITLTHSNFAASYANILKNVNSGAESSYVALSYGVPSDYSSETRWLAFDFGAGAEKTIDKITHLPYGEGAGGQGQMKDWKLYGNSSANLSGATLLTSGTMTQLASGDSMGPTESYNFINSTAYRYYIVVPTSFYLTSSYIYMGRIGMMETITSDLATNYWLMFDPASGFSDGTEVKIFNQAGNVWRKIARNNDGTWEYNDDSSNTAAEDWKPATVNEMLHVVSEAVASQTTNRMTWRTLNSITDTQWEETEGWSNSVNSIVRGMTLYSSDSARNTSISQYRLNYDAVAGTMDLKSKAYDPGFVPSEAYVWARAEHSDADGAGTFSVSRNSGAQWEVVPMTQQGLSFGDIRIIRGTVDLGTQPSGQDLRCRYQTAQGKDQFLHSWGLQAKS
jgi:hypothetical protein